MKKNIYYRIRLAIAFCAAVLFLAAFFWAVYPLKIFDLQLGPLLQRIFTDFSVTALVLASAILIITFLLGRLYCSAICPLGILPEIAGIFKKKNSGRQKNLFLKYIIAAIVFGTLAGGTVYLLRLAEPYTYFGSAFTLSAIGLIAVIAIIATVFIKDRFFCTNLCPAGTILGLISKFSINKIYFDKGNCVSCGICENICPSGCVNSKEKIIDNEICVKCLKCLNVCNKNAVKYGMPPKEEIKFSLKKRQFVLAASTIALFAAAMRAGSAVKKILSENFSDVILPPGALNEERFLNKCLNCNLCVKICPEKIIKKSDGNYGAVSIDYGKGFCKYDCNECGAACPAGALKKLSLERKQKLRIAMISPPTDKFEGFDACVGKCPTGALTLNAENKPGFSAGKCIGCGACVAVSGGNIKIYGTKEQKFL